MKIRAMMLGAGTLALALGALGCDTGTTEGTDSEVAEFQTAVPGMQMMTLGFEDQATVSGALTTEEGELGEPSAFKEHAQMLMDKVNGLLQLTHDQAEATFEDAEPITVTKGAYTCKRWEADGRGGKAHWRMSSCLKDKGAKKYAFRIDGRPMDSASDDDYLVVFAGEGKVLPKQAQEAGNTPRGAGFIGYNFDNLATLTGKDVAGRMGVGYFGLGKARHLVLALDGVKGANADQARTGIYRYKRVVGQGGHFSFVGLADWLTLDAGGAPIAGKDGTDELARAAIAWKADGAARTALTACGGTLGEGVCLRLVQCWAKTGAVEYEAAEDAKGQPSWDKKACPAMPYDVEVPGESDLDVPTPDAESGAPGVAEPAGE